MGIACDVTQYGLHSAHTVGEKYIHALAHGAQAMPFLIPAFGDGKDIQDLSSLYSAEDIVSRLDGLFLPGSPSNIQPQNYAGEEHQPGTLEDPQRDSLTLQLIRCCIEQGGANIGAVSRVSRVERGSGWNPAHQGSGY